MGVKSHKTFEEIVEHIVALIRPDAEEAGAESQPPSSSGEGNPPAPPNQAPSEDETA